MNSDYTAKITEIFYSVDEFCKQIEPVESTGKCKIRLFF